MKLIRYNIRVYGILLNHKNEVLVTNEDYKGVKMKKFPGGGHQLGESIVDCLKREFIEEFNFRIKVTKHLYTTDFLQISAFNSQEQLLSIYYLVQPEEDAQLEELSEKLMSTDASGNNQVINWVALSAVASYDFTFPIDKKVAAMLSEYLNN